MKKLILFPIAFILFCSACNKDIRIVTYTVVSVKEKHKDKTLGQALDKKLLTEVYNHWSIVDVTGGLHPSFKVYPDSTCEVTNQLLYRFAQNMPRFPVIELPDSVQRPVVPLKPIDKIRNDLNSNFHSK